MPGSAPLLTASSRTRRRGESRGRRTSKRGGTPAAAGGGLQKRPLDLRPRPRNGLENPGVEAASEGGAETERGRQRGEVGVGTETGIATETGREGTTETEIEGGDEREVGRGGAEMIRTKLVNSLRVSGDATPSSSSPSTHKTAAATPPPPPPPPPASPS